jgi:hypothetical protein
VWKSPVVERRDDGVWLLRRGPDTEVVDRVTQDAIGRVLDRDDGIVVGRAPNAKPSSVPAISSNNATSNERSVVFYADAKATVDGAETEEVGYGVRIGGVAERNAAFVC